MKHKPNKTRITHSWVMSENTQMIAQSSEYIPYDTEMFNMACIPCGKQC
jgi:hypothetical protein